MSDQSTKAVAGGLRSSGLVRQSPRQRLETALDCIRNARVRLQIRRIFANEIPNASVFWDEQERQVELVANDWEIIIRERDDTCHLPNGQAERLAGANQKPTQKEKP